MGYDSRYRREALPAMAGTILELDQLTAESEQAIENMERGRTATTRLDDAGTVGSSDMGKPYWNAGDAPENKEVEMVESVSVDEGWFRSI